MTSQLIVDCCAEFQRWLLLAKLELCSSDKSDTEQEVTREGNWMTYVNGQFAFYHRYLHHAE